MNTLQHLQPNTTLQGGKYRIDKVLGQGGFGITYLAMQTSLNRKVAIKELFIGGNGQAINERRGNMVVVTNSANQASFNQQKEKFKKEALRLANLNHPNLVKVHEFFEENGTAYYVMDYIEGESLRSKFNREGALSESLVLNYIHQLLPALDVAHKQSIWHLDIKPENIMVDRYGHVYLIDFGASKHVEPNSTLTTSLSLAYTPGYCPPELIDLSNETPEYYLQAIKDIGPWTDIYALGATMYNLLTDSIPPSKRRLEKEGRNAFVFSNNVSLSTQDMIIWMMKLDREERPQSVKDLQNMLQIDSIKKEKTVVSYEHLIDGRGYVDLGLPSGILWATCNVGANRPEEYGDYFAWGETKPKDKYTFENYKWNDGGRVKKYGNTKKKGIVDNKFELDLEDDAAYINWGAKWRIPSEEQFKELLTHCTWKWTSINGVKGFCVNGKNSNYIFLPAAGGKDEISDDAGNDGHYWTLNRTKLEGDGGLQFLFKHDDDDLNPEEMDPDNDICECTERYCGLSIRPVRNK